jgi:hypothetical protein
MYWRKRAGWKMGIVLHRRGSQIMRQDMQKEAQKGRRPNQIIQRIKEILLPLVLLGMVVIIVESLVASHLFPFPALMEKILILPALLIALFLHLGSVGVLSDKEWSQSNVVGCIPNACGLCSILGYLSYLVGISIIVVPAWNQWSLGTTFMYLSGILSVPLLVFYLQTPHVPRRAKA